MENSLNYKKDETVYLPSDDGCYSIRKFDWNRIKRKAEGANKRESIDFKLIYSILFGVAGSAGVSLVPIAFANDLPVWVAPLYIIATIFSAGVGLVLVYMNSKTEKNKSIGFDEIITEMNEVEQLFIVQNNEDNLLKRETGLVILEAIYGSVDKNKDMAPELTKFITDNKLNIKIDNSIAGDPHPNQKKQLNVSYKLNGNEESITLSEGETLNLG